MKGLSITDVKATNSDQVDGYFDSHIRSSVGEIKKKKKKKRAKDHVAVITTQVGVKEALISTSFLSLFIYA